MYQKYLTKAIPVLGLIPKPRDINRYLSSVSCSIGGKHAYFRALSVFFNWLYNPKTGFGFNNKFNPVTMVDPPKRPKLILPCLTKEQVEMLIDATNSIRNKKASIR